MKANNKFLSNGGNNTMFSGGTLDPKASMGGSGGGATYSTIANIPKAKKTKLI